MANKSLGLVKIVENLSTKYNIKADVKKVLEDKVK